MAAPCQQDWKDKFLVEVDHLYFLSLQPNTADIHQKNVSKDMLVYI